MLRKGGGEAAAASTAAEGTPKRKASEVPSNGAIAKMANATSVTSTLESTKTPRRMQAKALLQNLQNGLRNRVVVSLHVVALSVVRCFALLLVYYYCCCCSLFSFFFCCFFLVRSWSVLFVLLLLVLVLVLVLVLALVLVLCCSPFSLSNHQKRENSETEVMDTTANPTVSTARQTPVVHRQQPISDSVVIQISGGGGIFAICPALF